MGSSARGYLPKRSGERFGIFVFSVLLSEMMMRLQNFMINYGQLTRNRKRKPISGICFLFPILALTSCSTMTLDTYPDAKASTYRESTVVPGLMMQIDPILTDEEAKRYFGERLLENDILAVHVSVWNVNPEKSYLITDESFRIIQDATNGAVNRPESKSENSAAIVGATALGAQPTIAAIAGAGLAGAAIPAGIAPALLVAAPFAVYVLPFVAGKVGSDATVIRENFESKKFPSTTLESNEKRSGFLYFNWKALSHYDAVNLCLLVTEAGSNERYFPCFDIRLKK